MKKISIDEIKQGNGLVGAPVPVTIQFVLDGEDVELDTYIRKFSYASAVAKFRSFQAGQSDDAGAPPQDQTALAGIIASCVTDKKGKLIFSENDVREKFSQGLVEALWSKIYELNHPKTEEVDDGTDDDAPGKSVTKSPGKTKSGLSSSSTESADEPSPKPSSD